MSNEIIPLTDEQAKAVQETGKFLTKALGVAEGGASYVANVLGKLPHDLVGLVGDTIHHVRVRNLVRLSARTDEILRERGITQPQPVALSLAEPLLKAAADENRSELRELWARLLAAAMDPTRPSQVRQAFIATVKQLDPLDAGVLDWARTNAASTNNTSSVLAQQFKVTPDDVQISMDHLHQLRCLNSNNHADLSHFGRELMRACYG